ncbi:MAG: S1C family serine protease [Vicinamibacterales bacterium]
MTRSTRFARSVGLVALALVAGVMLVRVLETAVASEETAAAPVLRVDSIARVARARSGSVVFLHTVSPQPAGSTWFDGPRPGLAPPGALRDVREGLGSGVVIDAPGWILTNAHVVEGSEAIHFRTADGDDGDATIVGVDRDLDIALLQAHGTPALRPIPLGDSDAVNVGDWVVAIGSPFGLHHTVTAGIVSAKARGIDDSGFDLLQTDVAINPGSSGGALLNLNGSLIGVTTAIVSAAGENIGLNFAIPINEVTAILKRLRAGDVVRGWVGMRTTELSRAVAQSLGVDAGLMVIALADDGPAAESGIRLGDVVQGLGGPLAAPPADLTRRVLDAAPGTTMVVRVWREGRSIDVPVEVGERPRIGR